MKSSVFSILLLLALAFTYSSCSKYEEGPATLASKKSRLVNHWRVQMLTSNGADITGWNLVTEVIIQDDHNIIVKGAFLGFPTQALGKWAFNADKSRVLVTNNDGSFDDYEIIMLQKDESKFRVIDVNGAEVLYHLVTY